MPTSAFPTPRLRTVGRAAAVTAVFALTPALVADAGDRERSDEPRLVGRAVLPVETYAPGPPSGAFFGNVVTNGIQFPLPSQPVEGFSGIVSGRRSGEYLAMPDNGFGNKANSSDFLIRAYYIRPDFPRRDTGDVAVGDFISFSDPNSLIGFAIVNETTPDRLLTGADIDPESIQRGRHGELWIGDEFGPWILHFDRFGHLLEAPIALPDGLMSPSNPHLGTSTPTVNGSRGIEAMAITHDRKSLIVVLEGAVPGDDPALRRIYELDLHSRQFVRHADYRVESPGNFVSDAQSIARHGLIVIERDGGRGESALFRRAYSIGLEDLAADGTVSKQQLVDLAAIPDPKGISLPALHDGDVGLGDPFRVTCESIEAVHVISRSKLLFGCDNNFPNTGRNPLRADDNELIVVKVAGH